MVPDVVRLLEPVLLAARKPHILRRIFGANDHDLFANLVEQRRYVETEGGMSALMPAGKTAIDPNLRDIIHRAEMQDDALLATALGRLEGAAVPDNGMEARIADAGCLRFGRERNYDLPIEISAFPVHSLSRLI